MVNKLNENRSPFTNLRTHFNDFYVICIWIFFSGGLNFCFWFFSIVDFYQFFFELLSHIHKAAKCSSEWTNRLNDVQTVTILWYWESDFAIWCYHLSLTKFSLVFLVTRFTFCCSHRYNLKWSQINFVFARNRYQIKC